MNLVNIARAAVNVLPVVDLVNAIPVKVWDTIAATRKKNALPVAVRARVRFAVGWENAIFAKGQARKDGDNYFIVKRILK